MSTEAPPPLPTTPPPGSPAPGPKRSRFLLWGCGGLLALLLLIIATVAITLWWIQRPIKPVVLTPKEKTVVEQKLRAVDEASPPATTTPKELVELPGPVISSQPPSQKPPAPRPPNPPPAPDRPYEPGSKTIKLTEREVNGLLNENTDLGKSVRIEFARDAVNAYVVVPIPQDFPIGGGRMFRARGRFRLSLGNGGTPVAMIEDVTVFSVSLPKAWLGGIKGENLLADAVGKEKNGPVLRGIKSLRIEPGALLLELED